jgi:hypothetical protein
MDAVDVTMRELRRCEADKCLLANIKVIDGPVVDEPATGSTGVLQTVT